MSRIASGLISVVVDRERLMAQIYQDLGIEAHEIAIRSLTPDSMPAKMKYGPESIFDNNPILRRVPTDSSTGKSVLYRPRAGPHMFGQKVMSGSSAF